MGVRSCGERRLDPLSPVASSRLPPPSREGGFVVVDSGPLDGYYKIGRSVNGHYETLRFYANGQFLDAAGCVYVHEGKTLSGLFFICGRELTA